MLHTIGYRHAIGLLLGVFMLSGLGMPAHAAFFGKKNMDFIVEPYLVHPDTDTMTVMFEAHCVLPKVLYRQVGREKFEEIRPERLPLLPTLHRARIKGLLSDTEYEYRIETPTRKSDTYRFRTWPTAADGVDRVKIIAISDTQGDHPERLRDTITNGILRVEAQGDADRAASEIRALLITGDLVTSGSIKSQWTKDFFPNLQPLISRVPVLPAIGNHDQLPFFFAAYFDMLPDGSAPLTEEGFFYAKDLLNLRILTLDTNLSVDAENLPDITDIFQRKWLERELDAAAFSPSTDFVLAQFHHPCKSELWPVGNSRRACDYVKRLETFTREAAKPSLHFYGHTHGYSRGQSRDVSHLWVNVATTAGHIDYWGEYEQIDYEEIQKSEDTYGYVMVEVRGGEEASLRLVRRSGGNGIISHGFSDDTLSDTFLLPLRGQGPEQPLMQEAFRTETGDILLKASAFAGETGEDRHLETHWQLSGDAAFSHPVQIWGNATRSENIWHGDNIQEGVDITRYQVKKNLFQTPGFARVRYRDETFAWSPWSEPLTIPEASGE
ncbi:FN3 domain-containing metallophosphoesterase family protein [Desulfobotulus sp.]|uniref:FN3 domain-containing metallophosphoesterase family protein n=1 Tax=Desulfobotulus sp. TaxID=1940337 RepID=UPI002A365FA4|nr:FN3 domain-containing metallophosphoesterase family protein [Desulfobotulus sp.]MDY0164660.1 FN3 domain-containing metallophosphoesterase family protein [Desulfobotulus sp.]